MLSSQQCTTPSYVSNEGGVETMARSVGVQCAAKFQPLKMPPDPADAKAEPHFISLSACIEGTGQTSKSHNLST